MSTNFEEIKRSALALDEKRRAELAQQLSNSLDEHVDEDIDQAWLEELQRRKDEITSGNVTPVPGEEVLKNARKLVRQIRDDNYEKIRHLSRTEQFADIKKRSAEARKKFLPDTKSIKT